MLLEKRSWVKRVVVAGVSLGVDVCGFVGLSERCGAQRVGGEVLWAAK